MFWVDPARDIACVYLTAGLITDELLALAALPAVSRAEPDAPSAAIGSAIRPPTMVDRSSSTSR